MTEKKPDLQGMLLGQSKEKPEGSLHLRKSSALFLKNFRENSANAPKGYKIHS